MLDLKVFYSDMKNVNEQFDKEVELLAKKFGLHFVGSGYNFEDKIRDLHFHVNVKIRGRIKSG